MPETEKEAEDTSAFSQVVRPTRHFRVERPAKLADADALSIYDRILDAMVAGYVKSKNPTAAGSLRRDLGPGDSQVPAKARSGCGES